MANGENNDSRVPEEFLRDLANRDRKPNANVSLTIDDILSAPATSSEMAQTQVEQLVSSVSPGPGIPPIGVQNQFPGLISPTRVGQFQGRITGSTPLFAASVVFPFAVADARNRALQEAAAQRKQRLQLLQAKFKIPQGPAQFKRQIDSAAFNLLDTSFDEAVRVFGSSDAATEALLGPGALFNPSGRKFQEQFAVIKEMRDKAVFLDEASRKILDLESKPEIFIPKAFRDAAINIQGGLLDLQAAVDDPSQFAQTVGNLQTFDNITNLINTQVLPKLQPSIRIAIEEMSDKQIQTLMSTSDFTVLSQVVQQFVTDEDARTLAKALFRDNTIFIFEKDEEATIEAMKDQILSFVGQQIKADPIIVKKFNEGARVRIAGAARGKDKTFLFTELSNRTENLRGGYFKILNNQNLTDEQKSLELRSFIDGQPELRLLNNQELIDLGFQFDRGFFSEVALPDVSLSKEFGFSLNGARVFNEKTKTWERISDPGRGTGAIEKILFGYRDKTTGRFYSEAELKDNPNLLSSINTEAALRIIMQEIASEDIDVGAFLSDKGDKSRPIKRVYKDLPFDNVKGVPAGLDAFFKGEQDPQRTADDTSQQTIILDLSEGG